MRVDPSQPLSRRAFLRFWRELPTAPEATTHPVLAAARIKKTLAGQPVEFSVASALSWLGNALKQ